MIGLLNYMKFVKMEKKKKKNNVRLRGVFAKPLVYK